jgi:1-acyl-sn-glycerol-3-phosphate acyltransferase
VLPFRASLLASLFPPLPGVKVQPVAIDYGAAGPDIAWTGEEGAGENARRVLSRKGTAEVVIQFLEPIDPGTIGDRKALAEQCRLRILAALGVGASAQ